VKFSEKGPNRIKELWGAKGHPSLYIKEAATTLIIVKGSKL